MMTRRTFLCGLTLGTLAAPLAAGAQQAGRVYTVGTLSIGFLDPAQPDWWRPFIDAMRELNYVVSNREDR
jgi:hypothetical protein